GRCFTEHQGGAHLHLAGSRRESCFELVQPFDVDHRDVTSATWRRHAVANVFAWPAWTRNSAPTREASCRHAVISARSPTRGAGADTGILRVRRRVVISVPPASAVLAVSPSLICTSHFPA